MSAYVVDTKTIERILDYMAQDAERGIPTSHQTGSPPYWTGQPISPRIFTEYDLMSADGLQELGTDLLDMNKDAVRQRYPGSEPLPGPIEPQILDYSRNGQLTPDVFEAHKSIACLLYQAAEGDVFERPLYKALQEYQWRIASAYLTSRERYTDAKGW